jgi:hypothetical protein
MGHFFGLGARQVVHPAAAHVTCWLLSLDFGFIIFLYTFSGFRWYFLEFLFGFRFSPRPSVLLENERNFALPQETDICFSWKHRFSSARSTVVLPEKD